MASPILSRLLGANNSGSMVQALLSGVPICKFLNGLEMIQANYFNAKDFVPNTLVRTMREARNDIRGLRILREPGIISMNETGNSFFAIYGFHEEAAYHLGNLFGHACCYEYVLPEFQAKIDGRFAQAFILASTVNSIAYQIQRRHLMTESAVFEILNA